MSQDRLKEILPTSKRRLFVGISLCAILGFCVGCSMDSAPVPTSVHLHFTYKSAQPSNDSLYPIFPNPFNRVTGDTSLAIQFTLRDSGAVALVIQNAIGNQIAVFSDSILPPGFYAGWWSPFASDGTPLMSGIYFVTLNNGDFINSRLVDIQENQ